MTSWKIKLRPVDAPSAPSGDVVLELTGEIDASNAGELDHALREQSASGPLILDLSGVEFFDSAGFAVLHRWLAEGALVLVISPDSLIRRAALIVNLIFHDSLNDALAAIATAASSG